MLEKRFYEQIRVGKGGVWGLRVAVERTKGIERDGAFSQVSEHAASSQNSLAGSLSASYSQNSMTGSSGCVENGRTGACIAGTSHK